MGFRHLTLARAGFAAVAILAAAFATPAAAQRSIKVALEGSLTGAYAPFLVAEDRGFYRAEGLEVSIDATASPPDAISRIANGSADIGLADINAVMRFREQNPGAPLKAVFIVYNKPPYAVVARKSRGIAKPKDLEGKRIGTPPGEMASSLWPVFAKLNDIDTTKVKIENLAAAVREPMLAAGQTDAVTGTSFSAYLNLKERGVPLDDLIILQMADYGLPLYGDAIVVNTTFAANHPEAVKGFLRAFLKALKETIRAPARAVESVLKRNDNAEKDIELERLRMVIRDNIVTEEVQANGLGGVDPERLARGIDLLTKSLKPKAKIEPSDLFDASFLPPLAERRMAPARPG
ncbi:MAG TPA: ABC transporter substrate-binding protein [Xanthobacteraceae bacterium]|nr:ABC transporter substrate-binding protein [Xanthobacteraceae bacterium]